MERNYGATTLKANSIADSSPFRYRLLAPFGDGRRVRPQTRRDRGHRGKSRSNRL